MKKLILILWLLLTSTASADYLGSWKIDDTLTFTVQTQSFTTGASTDADSVPTYRIYEDETGTPIATGSMSLLDDTNTVGFYSEQISLSGAASLFEQGRSYSIRVSATVGSVTAATVHTFQILSESNVPALTAASAEPTGVPAANESLVEKIGYLFAALRNKVTVDEASPDTKKFYSDADALLWTKDLSGSNTNYTEGEGH